MDFLVRPRCVVHVRQLVSFEDDYVLLLLAVAAVFVNSDEAFPIGWSIRGLGAGEERVLRLRARRIRKQGKNDYKLFQNPP